MNQVVKGIGFLEEVYGLHICGQPSLLGSLASLKERVREVRLELTCRGELILVYGFVPGMFSGFVPLIVPIREAQSGEAPGVQVSVVREEETECPHGWRREAQVDLAPCLGGEGFFVWAAPALRSSGVVSEWFPDKGLGFIQSGGRLLFLGRWTEGTAIEIGGEVEFLPVAEIGKGLQARVVRGSRGLR